MAKEYALYHGDHFKDIGTLSYLADEFSVSEKTLLWTTYPSAKKRQQKKGYKGYILVPLDSLDDGEEICGA